MEEGEGEAAMRLRAVEAREQQHQVQKAERNEQHQRLHSSFSTKEFERANQEHQEEKECLEWLESLRSSEQALDERYRHAMDQGHQMRVLSEAVRCLEERMKEVWMEK